MLPGPCSSSRWLDIGQIKFFFCVFMDRDGVEVYKHANKNQAMTEQAWPIKGFFLIWLSVKFFLRDTASSPERAR